MTRRDLRRLSGLPRGLYRRSRARSRSREENRFQSRLHVDPAAPELVLSPHWDDAVLDCWSLLAGERRLRVVNLFAGVPAPGTHGVWEEIMGVSDSAARTRERIAEDARALALAGREPCNLPLLDDRYRRPTGSVLDLNDLDRALTAEVQSASHVYVPAGIGAHPDHLLARRYGRMLLRHGMPVTLYAELPYCIFHGWPSWVDGREPAPNRNVDAYWQSFLRDVPEMPALHSAAVERLDDATASTKCKALQCYETSLNYGARRLLETPEFHRFEVRWELVGPAGDTRSRGRNEGLTGAPA
jgi:hypothetical protein